MHKFQGIPAGNFIKTNSLEFPGIPEQEFPVTLLDTRLNALLSIAVLVVSMGGDSGGESMRPPQ